MTMQSMRRTWSEGETQCFNDFPALRGNGRERFWTVPSISEQLLWGGQVQEAMAAPQRAQKRTPGEVAAPHALQKISGAATEAPGNAGWPVTAAAR